MSKKQQGSSGEDGLQPEMLGSLSVSDPDSLTLPPEEERPSLAKLWDTDAIMEQKFCTKLARQALQPLPLEQTRLIACSAGWQPAQQMLHPLPRIIVQSRLMANGVAERMLCSSSAMFPALSLPETGSCDITLGLTFLDLVMPGQVLCDQYPTLPLVHIDSKPAISLPALHAPIRIAQGMQAKALGLAATELLLDWSLKEPAAPDPAKRLMSVSCRPTQMHPGATGTAVDWQAKSHRWLPCTRVDALVGEYSEHSDAGSTSNSRNTNSGCHPFTCCLHTQVREKMKRALTPQALPQPEKLPSLPAWPETIEQLRGGPVPQREAVSCQEQLPAILLRISQRYSGQQMASPRYHLVAQSRKPFPGKPREAGRRMTDGAAHEKNGSKAGGSSRKRPREDDARGAGKGVFQRPRKGSKERKGRALQTGQDAAFYMGLQEGNAEPASEVSGSSDDSLADG